MSARGERNSVRFAWPVVILAGFLAGCTSRQPVPAAPLPVELNKVNHPPYRIEPPDILEINALQVIPLPPYRIRPLDAVFVRVPKAFDYAPISGLYPVSTEGRIDFGDPYGPVTVVGMTLSEAKTAIEKQLDLVLKEPKAEVLQGESRALQQIRGQHLVRQDGTVSLGEYGAVNVTGLTLPDAKAKIEAHLSQYLLNPEVTVDVLGFNSKVYYIILDGGGYGQQVLRLPVVGNETVLDAISQVYGLTTVSDSHRIWISRPGPDGCQSILPVDWTGLTQRAEVQTNYQLLPGDRVFVQSRPLVRIDTALSRIISPIERIFGVTLLGNNLVRQFLIPIPKTTSGVVFTP
jgi:polysaccharide export outer membrane protein